MLPQRSGRSSAEWYRHTRVSILQKEKRASR